MKALIVGGGIGGLMTGIALQNIGIECKIFEQAALIEEVGAGIWIAPNAMSILEKFTLADAVTGAGRPLRRAWIMDTKGGVITKMDYTAADKPYKYSGCVAIHRAALYHVLRNAVHPGSLFLDKYCTGFSQHAGKVQAIFKDGSVEEGDLLVGADGIWSQVRRQLYPFQQLRYTKQYCWRFVVSKTTDQLPVDDGFELWSTERGLRCGYSNIGNDNIYVYITHSISKHPVPGKGKVRSFLLQLCKDFPFPVADLIAAANEDDFIGGPLADLPMKSSWVNKRVALLGDAAHASAPNLGQGACQAIEDAYALHKALQQYNDPVEALRHYHALRHKKAGFIKNMAWQLSNIINLNGWQKKIMIKLIRSTPAFIMARQERKIYSIDYLEQ